MPTQSRGGTARSEPEEPLTSGAETTESRIWYSPCVQDPRRVHNSVLYIAGVTQHRDRPDARTFIDRKITEGKTRREARRARTSDTLHARPKRRFENRLRGP